MVVVEKVLISILILILSLIIGLIIFTFADIKTWPDENNENVKCGKLGYDKAFIIDTGYQTYDVYCGHLRENE